MSTVSSPHTHTHYSHTQLLTHTRIHTSTHILHTTHRVPPVPVPVQYQYQYHRIGLAMPLQGMLGMVAGPSKERAPPASPQFWASRAVERAQGSSANRCKPIQTRLRSALWAYQAVPNLALAVDSALVWVASVLVWVGCLDLGLVVPCWSILGRACARLWHPPLGSFSVLISPPCSE